MISQSPPMHHETQQLKDQTGDELFSGKTKCLSIN